MRTAAIKECAKAAENVEHLQVTSPTSDVTSGKYDPTPVQLCITQHHSSLQVKQLGNQETKTTLLDVRSSPWPPISPNTVCTSDSFRPNCSLRHLGQHTCCTSELHSGPNERSRCPPDPYPVVVCELDILSDVVGCVGASTDAPCRIL